MKKVILLRGLPASGKSTLARQMLDENRGTYKRLNKDELRAMLDNSEHSTHNEKFVEHVRDLMLIEALRDGKHVIIDDTNLSDRPVERIRQVVQKYCKDTGEQVKIEIREMSTTLEESLARDEVREKKVGRDVIMRMYKTHVLGDERGPHYQPQDTSLPPAILCDLDGTLAILRRNPYDSMACERDDLNEPIAQIIKNYHTLGVKIILMSGREEKSRMPTTNWLKYNNIPYDALYMRTTGDMRKDAVIKKELFEAHVKGQYYVQFVLDDRNQVVDLWRLELGLPCLQVNYGDF
ncbi:phosphatase domain-containing protein [Runella slithyformis]|uniref:Polynucleotide 5'-hydroxyl-kinase n=1 Tax=Runella slithyformis (strain ATCC 29530 / DSM 19594 / LMG 11500 / NCIMB 11436 / LSU 4) TaxID=761193 RepID=A0A7U3ZHG3_RUNSL|nr:AAA family ATPase [Runella slithyformis]AEI47230.1 Polynucleotide 5'-hydroxyl-kinase [Runella slithyformis DSM 19594]